MDHERLARASNELADKWIEVAQEDGVQVILRAISVLTASVIHHVGAEGRKLGLLDSMTDEMEAMLRVTDPDEHRVQ